MGLLVKGASMIRRKLMTNDLTVSTVAKISEHKRGNIIIRPFNAVHRRQKRQRGIETGIDRTAAGSKERGRAGRPVVGGEGGLTNIMLNNSGRHGLLTRET